MSGVFIASTRLKRLWTTCAPGTASGRRSTTGERRVATLHLMMFMSDFREAMWGVVQTVASDLDVDFKDYAATHFARMQDTASNPSFGQWLEEARDRS